MQLAWIDDFLALAEEAHFSRTAERRHVTQPALSRRIRALEDWVGAELFDRASRHVALTAAGRAFRPAAEDVRRRLGQGREDAREAARSASSIIRLACTHMLASTWLPYRLAAAELDLPHTASMELRVDNMVACERLMRWGEADLLLCHHADCAPAELDPAAFRRTWLASDRLVAVSAPDATGAPLHAVPETTGRRTPYLAFRDESGLGRILRNSIPFRDLSRRLDAVFHSHAVLTLTTLARSGRGLAFVPLSLVQADFDQGRLVHAGGEATSIEIEICLIRPIARSTQAIEAFWRLACERAQGTLSDAAR